MEQVGLGDGHAGLCSRARLLTSGQPLLLALG